MLIQHYVPDCVTEISRHSSQSLCARRALLIIHVCPIYMGWWSGGAMVLG